MTDDRKPPISDAAGCPVGRFFSELESVLSRESNFSQHMKRSRLEFLKAIRSLVDERIQSLEEEDEQAARRATKIEVT